MKRIRFTLHLMWLGLLSLVPVACGSNSESSSNPDLTATADYATQLHLCCTATPQITATPPSNNANIVLDRGNAQRTGVYDVPSIRDQPEVKWQTKVSSTWLMPPMLADGMLYTGSGDGVLYALNAETGEIMWSAEGFEALESTGAIAGEIIVTGGFSRLVRAFDRQNGNVLWTYRSGYPVQGSPLIVEDRVFIATDHAVYAMALQTGELIWQAATGNENAFMGAPAFDNGVIYTTGGKLLLALDAETGKELWRVEKDTAFLGVAVADQQVYVGNWDLNLYAFDQSTGEERWKFKGKGQFWSAPAANGDVVYAGNIDQYLYALNMQTGELLWSYKTGGDAVSEPLIADDVVYVSDSSHLFPRGPRHLYALNALTGEELWMFESEGTFLPAPTLGDGVIYVTSTGDVLALK